MTMAGQANRPRRPAALEQHLAEEIPGGDDPTAHGDVGHMTAAALVHRGREQSDPAVLDRLVRLVDSEGIELVAQLWADTPAVSLPGALWRLYLLREWVRRDPDTVVIRYRAGADAAPVADAVAGVVAPPGPDDVRDLADAVLHGVYAGELDVALHRAAAFCRVVATGGAFEADRLDGSGRGPSVGSLLERTVTGDGALSGHGSPGDGSAIRVTRASAGLTQTADDLDAAAVLWRSGSLE